MSDVKYSFTLNGETWHKKQLERLEYERNLHILHSMKRHGVDIKDGDRSLSDDDIDYLTAQKAWDVSIDNRLEHTGEDIINLYKDSIKKSDEFWKELGFSQDKPMKVSRSEMKVSGVSLKEYMGMMRSMQTDDRVGLSVHPEHFVCSVTWDDGQLVGVEPFGMYGTPTLGEVKVVPDEELGDAIKADKDPEYPIAMAGEAFLTGGEVAVNIPFHQFKPTEDGFEAKMAVYWSENTPDEIVDGHALHLAMEFYGGLKETGKLD